MRDAFSASASGGWVRFLARGPHGTPYTKQSTDNEFVTGIAFGRVVWLVSKDDIMPNVIT